MFNAKVEVGIYPYMGEQYSKEEFVSVEAETQDEAESKIYDYFKNKGNPYSTDYRAWEIEFFTRID